MLAPPKKKNHLLLNYLDYQSSKVPKFQNSTNLCPQSGYGQVMGSAVLELWNFGGPPKFQSSKTAHYVPRVAMVRAWGLQFWNFGTLGGPPKFQSSKTAHYVSRVAMVRAWGLQFWNFGTLEAQAPQSSKVVPFRSI